MCGNHTVVEHRAASPILLPHHPLRFLVPVLGVGACMCACVFVYLAQCMLVLVSTRALLCSPTLRPIGYTPSMFHYMQLSFLLRLSPQMARKLEISSLLTLLSVLIRSCQLPLSPSSSPSPSPSHQRGQGSASRADGREGDVSTVTSGGGDDSREAPQSSDDTSRGGGRGGGATGAGSTTADARGRQDGDSSEGTERPVQATASPSVNRSTGVPGTPSAEGPGAGSPAGRGLSAAAAEPTGAEPTAAATPAVPALSFPINPAAACRPPVAVIDPQVLAAVRDAAFLSQLVGDSLTACNSVSLLACFQCPLRRLVGPTAAFLSAMQILHAYQPLCLPACLPTPLPAYPSSCPPACLPAGLPACLPACRSTMSCETLK